MKQEKTELVEDFNKTRYKGLIKNIPHKVLPMIALNG